MSHKQKEKQYKYVKYELLTRLISIRQRDTINLSHIRRKFTGADNNPANNPAPAIESSKKVLGIPWKNSMSIGRRKINTYGTTIKEQKASIYKLCQQKKKAKGSSRSKEGDVDQWRDKSNYVGLAHVSQRNVSNWSSRLRQEAKDVVGKHSRQNSRQQRLGIRYT